MLAEKGLIQMIKILMVIIACGAGLYGLILIFFYFFQEKIMFDPGPGKFGICPEMEQAGAEAVFFEDIRYYILRQPDPKHWFIIFHGISGNACGRTHFFDMLSALNANFVVFEYPGYGEDGKTPGQTLILEKALALLKHIDTLNSSGLPVYLLAESFGTGVATFAAAKTKVQGLILISPYPSLSAVAQNRYPWLPIKHFMRHPFPASDWAAQVQTPALIFHGTKDITIPIRLAREQFAAFAGEKEMKEIAGAEHYNIKEMAKGIIREKVKEFIGGQLGVQ
jgi:uncharacterized protein